MSRKKIEISTRPNKRAKDETTEEISVDKMNEFVDGKKEGKIKQPTKRLNIEIPEELHRKIKADCALRGVNMTDDLKELLMSRYGD